MGGFASKLRITSMDRVMTGIKLIAIEYSDIHCRYLRLYIRLT